MAKKVRKEIGLAVVGCGTIGRIRTMLACNFPGVTWLGVCDLKENLAKKLAEDAQADFWTTDYKELLKRSEINAAIIATGENQHVAPTLQAVERRVDMLIEKPLATDAKESQKILQAIQASGVDAVVGYTNRFRRRFLAIKERIKTKQIGEVTAATTRAFMNRMVPIATVRRTEQRKTLTPMVVSGTHSLDMSLWLLEGKEPVEVYARSVDKVLGKWGTKDATFGLFTMKDGTIWSMNISWALPTVWPGAVYSLEIGIVGTKGVITIDDTHRDLVLASEVAQGAGYKPEGFEPEYARHVDFLTSYPPGDVHLGQIWGAMRDETNSWLTRVCMGLPTPHASAADGHRNLVLTMAMDLSAARGKALKLPIELDEFYA
ncbi:MAG TPA: Gfo/Idh/MocA family oxidoreductase [Thermodesulfobacteriota bacterium]|nr:Gfo/Idh/MocA family oxidoreductase [Thermodesulfobacteriota bacterium]